MAKVFTKNLSNKQVMATDGTELGILESIIMEDKTGDLIDLVVKPDMGLDTSRYQKEGQFIIMPFTSVNSIKDYIVIEKSLARSHL